MRHVCGGIGDLIQSFDSVQEGERIRVFTHFKKAEDFFTPINADFEYRFFDSVQDLLSIGEEIKNSGEEVNRQIFQKLLSVPNERFERARKNAGDLEDIIGIHPVGSKLSNDFWSSVDKPQKLLPPWFVKAIIQENKNYFIFGTKEELTPYKEELKDLSNVKYIDYKNIWDSLCHVLCCKSVIAVDSCIKAMSCARKIQTLVFVGDYEDEFRDKNFISPYVREGIMKVIPFTTISRSHVRLVNEYTK